MAEEMKEAMAFRRWVAVAILCSLPMPLIFAFFGQNARGETAWFCTLMLLVAVRARWDLKRRRWFWMTVGAIFTLHTPLILFLPWTNRNLSGFALVPLGLLDFGVAYGTFALIEKLVAVGTARDPGKLN
jgi:hypothetical protein